MSHFSCLLVIPDALSVTPSEIRIRIDNEMAPFMENCCAEPDKIYMKFYDMEDEYRKEFEEGAQEKVILGDGRLVLPWDEMFRNKPTAKDPFPPCKAPDHLPRRMVPFKETYATLEEFAKEWHGSLERDDTYNRYGYWQNPNAKWDWYEIGGRWAGFFQLAPGHQGALGSQYNFSEELQPSSDKADICFKNAVDWERMRSEAEAGAAKTYDAVWKAIRGTPEPELWESVIEEFPGDIELARKKYHTQPRVKAFNKFKETEEGREMIGFFGSVENFHVSRGQYLTSARNHAAVPFALLKDGEWYQQGDMGWWGIAHNEKDPETWAAMVAKLMDDLPGETLLVVNDCHI